MRLRFWEKPAAPVAEYANSSYTDVLLQAIIRQASAASAPVTTSTTGALEAAAALVGRAFAAAEAHGPPQLTAALTPPVLAMMGRALIRSGDNTYYLETSGDRLAILPAQSHSVDGGPRPETWRYLLHLPGPSETESMTVPGVALLHLRYAASPATPWRGHGPLQVAADAGRLSAEVLAALADEASGPRGAFLPTPLPGDSAQLTELLTEIRRARGGMLTVESAINAWEGGGAGISASEDYKTRRFGPSPSPELVELANVARREVLACCGLNEALFVGAQSAALREAWRLALFSVIAPLGRLVEAELQAKLDPGITLSWQELRASDLTGRARAFQGMVNGGMAVAEAAALAGLMAPDDA